MFFVGVKYKNKCCVPECDDRVSKRHMFPRDLDMIQIWMEKIKNPKFKHLEPEAVRKKFRICHRHFSFEYEDGSNRTLLPFAIPTIHLPEVPRMLNYQKCAVPGCKHRFDLHPNVKFFRFSKIKDKCLSWLKLINNSKLNKLSHSSLRQCYSICDRHFDKSQFTTPHYLKLNRNAVPTLHLPENVNEDEVGEEEKISTGTPPTQIHPIAGPSRMLGKGTWSTTQDVYPEINAFNQGAKMSITKEKAAKEKEEEEAAAFVQKIIEAPEVIIVDDDDDDENKEEAEVKFIVEETSELDDVVDEINNLEKAENPEKDEFIEHSYCKETAGLCRLCQKNKGKFQIVLVDGLNDNIANYIKIDVSSPAGLPQVICSCCKTLIDSFHKFVLKVQYVNKQLENAYTKVETGPLPTYQHGVDVDDTNVPPDDSTDNKEDSKPPMLDCRLCNQSFTINTYFDHVKKNHKILYRCGIASCQQTFSSKGNLQRHMNRHIYKRERFRLALSNREFECQICKKAFGTKSILIRHRKNHYNFKCPVKDCDRILKSWNTYDAHRRLHGDQRRRLCHICGKTYSASTTFRAHQQTHSRRHVCQFCNKEYTTRAILLKHIEIKHEGVKYYCSQCPNSYSTRMNLIFHERVHTGKPGYKCSLCPKAFYRNSRLKIHMQTHQEGNPYECRICAKSFKLESSRRSHERIHLGEKFTCNVCNKIFTRIDRVKNHLKSKHPDEYKEAYEMN